MPQEENIKAQVYSNLEKPVRWNGIIDYKTLITVAFYIFLIWNVTSLFAVSVFTRLYIVIILTIPFFKAFAFDKRPMRELWQLMKLAEEKERLLSCNAKDPETFKCWQEVANQIDQLLNFMFLKKE